MRDRPDTVGDAPREGEPVSLSDRYRLAGPGGVEVRPWVEVELPEFHLDRRTDGRDDTPRESLQGFVPERAGLPETSLQEASAYIEQHKDERPWLRSADGASPEAQRVIVALDRGQGHPTERHEGEVTPQELRDRVTKLEDPAQLDPAQRERSQDAFVGGIHRCGDRAVHIWDPDAFATAFARGIEDPRIRARLDQPFDPGSIPDDAYVPVKDLLGKDGHRFCDGYQLKEVGGELDAARDCRTNWVHARRNERDPDVAEPVCEPIPTFEGGTVMFRFRPNANMDGYEVSTFFPEPPRPGLEGPPG